MSSTTDEHHGYLSDAARLAAFERAIAEVVRPGDVVVDLGAGTGILGLLACRAGARRVYAIERSHLVELVRALASANGFAERVTCVRGLSTEVELPERADVVVADQIGFLGIEAGIVEYFADARARFLKAGGRTIPGTLALRLAPVESIEARAQVDFWESRPAGLDFAPARRWAASTTHALHARPEHLLATPCEAKEVPLERVAPVRLDATFVVRRTGTLHGLAGWFAARLSSSAVLTNAPGAEGAIRRPQAFLPIDDAVPVAPGDRVEATLHALPGDVVSWTVRVAGRTFRHSTLGSLLVGPDDLRRGAPDFRPRASARGAARRLVLELMDGAHAVRAIEDAVARTHPETFRSRDEVARFVADVLARDGA